MKNTDKNREKYLKAKILSYWEIIGEDSENKKEFILFLEKNGIGRSTWYSHLSRNLKTLVGYKLEGLASVVDRYERLHSL